EHKRQETKKRHPAHDAVRRTRRRIAITNRPSPVAGNPYLPRSKTLLRTRTLAGLRLRHARELPLPRLRTLAVYLPAAGDNNRALVSRILRHARLRKLGRDLAFHPHPRPGRGLGLHG